MLGIYSFLNKGGNVSRPKSKEGSVLSKKGLKSFLSQIDLHFMVLPALICMILFNFLPLAGLQIAFKDYKFALGIWESPFAGLKHFDAIFSDPNIYPIIWNTIGLSFIKAFGIFPIPIIFAILLNEVTHTRYKKVVQTVSYFPYFLSWAVISLMAIEWLAPSGFINAGLVSLGILDDPYFFLGEAEAFWGVSVFLDIWKNVGYSSIIYLAAITGVDKEVVEASVIDGAGRFRRIINVTVPAILPTIMILLIMNVGNLLKGGSNFDISYNLGNNLNYDRSEIIDTYVLEIGISQARFAYATAIGLIQSVVSATLLVTTNAISKRLTGESFF